MEPWRTILLIATIAGFLVTVGGLVAAHRAARREHEEAGRRIALMQDLAEQEKEAHAAVERGPDMSGRNSAINVKYDGIYADHGLVRPSYQNLVYLAQHESLRLLGMVLDSTRRDFIVAGIGLLVSTLASAGSLYLASG